MVALAPPPPTKERKQRKLRPTKVLSNQLKEIGFKRFEVTNRRGTDLFDIQFWGDLDDPNAPTIFTAAEWSRRIRMHYFTYQIVELGDDVIAEHRPGKPIILTSLVLKGTPTPQG